MGQKFDRVRKEKVWWTEEIETLVNEKQKTYYKWLQTGDPEDRKIYVRANSEVKKKVIEEKIERGRKGVHN